MGSPSSYRKLVAIQLYHLCSLDILQQHWSYRSESMMMHTTSTIRISWNSFAWWLQYSVHL